MRSQKAVVHSRHFNVSFTMCFLCVCMDTSKYEKAGVFAIIVSKFEDSESSVLTCDWISPLGLEVLTPNYHHLFCSTTLCAAVTLYHSLTMCLCLAAAAAMKPPCWTFIFRQLHFHCVLSFKSVPFLVSIPHLFTSPPNYLPRDWNKPVVSCWNHVHFRLNGP